MPRSFGNVDWARHTLTHSVQAGIDVCVLYTGSRRFVIEAPASQDRARMRIDCRMITQAPPMPSTIPARFTPHGAL